MALECGTCTRYSCRIGRLDASPENCPMRGDFPGFDDLYGAETTRTLAYHAARVEAEGYGRWVRIREVAELATRMGYRKLGLAHCPETRREADLAARYLEGVGLEVMLPADRVRCGPVEQAERFRAGPVDLNVVVGMCVGHDALFIRHAAGPVTSLLVRDLRLRHNPAAALYTRTGYLKTALYGDPSRKRSVVSFSGWSDDLLGELANRVREGGLRRDPPPTRIEEIMDFAAAAGARHLGVVFCTGFREEARHLHAILNTNAFRVSSVSCKTGSIPKARVGIRDEEKVRPGRPEMLCNPVAQAELLEREKVDLVLLMGQCVGHDALTAGRLTTPAVYVVAKDRLLAHNPAAALYALEDDGGRAGPSRAPA